ncbi:hypothetical protein HPB50_007813 [Hyalomma asiaticum]|uniref:Uncharacterized protein n=1 Tax=Hyalomma asiaticum TaxID=266040 RepID=A0ACB7S7Q6_HYAAI|nr:hypothetical protein HPB50_007813 [Hyalomma asiaticum]
MATNPDNGTSCPVGPQTSGTPPPSAAGDFRPPPSGRIAIARTGRLPMSMPSERYVLPPGCIDQYRNVTVGSPSTPPQCYVARDNTRRPPKNGVARAAAAALVSFWYVYGTACTKCMLPHGGCPASQPGVYRTLGECSVQCMEKGRQAGSPRYGVPEFGECGLELLRHPYFADMDAERSARCGSASQGTLVHRRGPVGNNQFDSMKACQEARQG